jgi:hypothetical protein
MRRITTGTADADLFGDGKPGFIDGDATIALAPTRLNADWFNHLQEAVARCVEGDGATVVPSGDDPNYYQLDDAVQHGSDGMFPRSGEWASASRFVIEGFGVYEMGGHDIVLRPGRYVFDGRKYFVSGQKMIAAYPSSAFQVELEFVGTEANGDYVSTFDGFGLSAATPVTTTRAAGVPSDNDALATQHATDISAETDLNAVVVDATDVDEFVYLLIDGALAAGTIETTAPSGASIGVEYTGLHFSIDASRDTYFYIAPEDPNDIASPPDRATIHIETLDVANGASAPTTPDGTMLIAMVATDGSGVTAVTEFNRGPAILSGTFGAGLRMQPENFPQVAAALVPHGPAGVAPNIDIGQALPRGATAPDNSGYVRNVHSKRYTLLSDVSALQDRAIAEKWSEITTTAGGGVANVVLFDSAEWPEGSSFYLEVKGVAIDPSDATDAYSFRNEAHVHIDGGTPTLDGTGAGSPPPFEGGNGAMAAGVDVNFNISGTNVRLVLTGHSADALRWFFTVDVVGSGATP